VLRVLDKRQASPRRIPTDRRGKPHSWKGVGFLGEARLDEGGTDPSQQFHTGCRRCQQRTENVLLSLVFTQTVELPAAVVITGAGDAQVQ
jgi:hypothetical protein